MQKLIAQKKVQGKAVQKTKKVQMFSHTLDHPCSRAQAIIGNHGILSRYGTEIMQAKLNVGSPNDGYEQEAERVAKLAKRTTERQIQHRVEQVEGNSNANPGKTMAVTPETQAGIRSLRGKGRLLPRAARDLFEPGLGIDLSQVRVHTSRLANNISEDLDARAFTVSTDIFFGSGQYRPETQEGRQLLAHELTHVAQQMPLTGRAAQVIHRKNKNPLKDIRPKRRVGKEHEARVELALIKVLGKYIDKSKLKGKSTWRVKYLAPAKYKKRFKKKFGREPGRKDKGYYDRDKDVIVLRETGSNDPEYLKDGYGYEPVLETMIHETIHRFSNEALQIAIGRLNEGVTQYFTNHVLRECGHKKGKAYPGIVKAAEALKNVVGFDKLALLYFRGPGKSTVLAELKSKGLDLDTTNSSFRARFFRAIGKNKWDEVARMIRSGR